MSSSSHGARQAAAPAFPPPPDVSQLATKEAKSLRKHCDMMVDNEVYRFINA